MTVVELNVIAWRACIRSHQGPGTRGRTHYSRSGVYNVLCTASYASNGGQLHVGRAHALRYCNSDNLVHDVALDRAPGLALLLQQQKDRESVSPCVRPPST